MKFHITFFIAINWDVLHEKDVPHKPYEDSEWQANVFACELLIPHYRLHDGMTVDDVVERFGVTPAAAKSALKNYSR